jgi:hypothetical protein
MGTAAIATTTATLTPFDQVAEPVQPVEPPRRQHAAVHGQRRAGRAGTGVSPGLCRLLNVALVVPDFQEALVADPHRAALRVTQAPQDVFGRSLPDPRLQVPPIDLSPDDWKTLRYLPPVRSLAELWQCIGASQL